MEKEFVDGIISEYMKKIYGFALSKTMDIDKAEEIASKITLEVYKSLLKADNIFDINSYIYTIARNVYACFVMDEKNDNQFLNQVSQNRQFKELNKDKIYNRLRREISYLSNLQREIVVLYYFHKLKTKEIAKRLNLSRANVKWHLVEARNSIKDGFNENKRDSQKLRQITFTEIKYFGYLGLLNIDTSYFFSKSLTQNIAFSAYHKAKSSIEIAKELSVPVAFVEDEISHLVDNGYMNKAPNSKYLTNIYVIESSKEREERINEVYSKYAELVCEMYIPLLFESIKKIDADFVYTPQNDKNFLMWTIVAYACWKRLSIIRNKIDISKYRVKRKDDGDNIVTVTVGKDLETHKDLGCEYSDLVIDKDIYPIKTWQFISHNITQFKSYSHWLDLPFTTLYDFIKGKIAKNQSNIDKFVLLYSNDFLVDKNDSEYVNLIITSMPEESFIEMFPKIPEELKIMGQEFDDIMYKINKSYFPAHMHDLCRFMNENSFTCGQFRVYIFDYLLQKGLLKPLKRKQKNTANKIMFSDTLPQR